MAPQYGQGYNGRVPDHELSSNGSTTHRPISVPDSAAGGRRSRMDDVDAIKDKRQSMRVNGVTISTELFEKMFLLPQRESRGNPLQYLPNPTPVGLMGTIIALTPLSCDLMGWRGSGDNGIASIGAYYWFGGVLQLIGGFLNFVTGDMFSCVVFMGYGAFWLSFSFTLEPSYMAYTSYATDPTNPATGLTSPGFNSTFAFFLVFMGMLNVVFLICSLRTDITHVIAFSMLLLAFGLLAGQHFNIALGNMDISNELQYAAGATLFLASLAVWWLFLAEMLALLDFPFRVPVGDLSGFIKGRTEREMLHMKHMGMV